MPWYSASRCVGTGPSAWLSTTQQCTAHSTPPDIFTLTLYADTWMTIVHVRGLIVDINYPRLRTEEHAMRIAIAGATGRIGSQLAALARSQGHEVVEIARET